MPTASVFGLALSSEEPLRLCPLDGARAAGRGHPCRLELVEARTLEAEWAGLDSRRIALIEDPGGGDPPLTVEAHDAAGHLVEAHDRGTFEVSADGARIRCAPADAGDWRWERFLVGQVLPLAALRNGLEVLHASAASVDGRVVALTGPSRSGKSSVATQLVLAGADLVADDVIALTADGDGVVVHPGPGVLSLRPAELERLGTEALARLGRPIVEGERESLFAVGRVGRPVALGALYVLDSAAAPVDALRFEPVDDPGILLGSTFNEAVRDGERLIRLLDICARIGRTCPVQRAIVPGSVDAAGLAAAVAGDLRRVPAR